LEICGCERRVCGAADQIGPLPPLLRIPDHPQLDISNR